MRHNSREQDTCQTPSNGQT